MNATVCRYRSLGFVLISLSLGGPAFCQSAGLKSAPTKLTLDEVAEAVKRQDLDGALQSLAAVLVAGYPTPTDVLHQATFKPLVVDPAARARLRELLSQHVRESRITMVHEGEPGTRMLYRIRVVERSNGKPVSDAVVKVVHVDATGRYQQGDQEWNPRLFGFARTDQDGYIEVHSIRPAHYAAEYEADDEPAHVHVSLEDVPGFIPLGTEFWFEDDPRVAQTDEKMPLATISNDRKPARADVTIAINRQ